MSNRTQALAASVTTTACAEPWVPPEALHRLLPLGLRQLPVDQAGTDAQLVIQLSMDLQAGNREGGWGVVP
jgi:hypothetical protein